MRIFLAIDIPDTVKKKLDDQLSELKKDQPFLNWIPSKNYHITLQFYGEVDNVEKIKKRIENSVYDIPSFYMYSKGASLFIHHKIVLYIDFQRQKTLEELVSRIKPDADTPYHYSQQYKYVPHLTIARYKIPSKQQYFHLKKKLEQLDIDVEFPVNKVTLYQSILQTQAPLYKKIDEFSLLDSD